MIDVVLASCAALPEPDDDMPPLLAALQEAGLTAQTLPWDGAPWPPARRVLLRSTWNYARRPADFARWVDGLGDRVWNSARLVRWNMHKGYLLELGAAGVPVVPTEHVREGSLAAVRARRGWQDVIVKPAIGAGSWQTYRCTVGGDEALASVLATGEALVQPYQAAVEGYGERALVWVGGVTHAVRKTRRLAGDVEEVSAAVPVSAAEAALAEQALEVARRYGDPVYARIDVVPDQDGAPRVMELELIEPSLFFAQGPEALRRLVAALVQDRA